MASGVGGEQGILTTSNLTVTQRGAGANMSVDVASGLAYVVGDDVTAQGTYQCWSDATVNVTGPPWTVPGSGTYHHRLVLQVQDKLNNGSFSGYAANFVALLDTGSGLPAEPPSAITLATIDIPHGSASITNSMINDYRQRVGPVSVFKTSDTARTNTTTFADDPDLQLLNLQASSSYAFWGTLPYTGGNSGGAGGPYDFTWQWRVPAGTSMSYTAARVNTTGNFAGGFGFAATDSPVAQTQGTGTLMSFNVQGIISTGAAPAYAVLQWAPNNNVGTATTLKSGAWLRARRLG